MALSQAYLEWEKQTERRGQERGLEQGLEQGLERGLERGSERERESVIRSLMQLRYGGIDAALEALLPQLMAMRSEDYTRLLLELSREDLIAHFG